MCQLCLIYFYFFNISICTKRYHGMYKYQQDNFFSNVLKSIRPTYGNKEELASLSYIYVLGEYSMFTLIVSVCLSIDTLSKPIIISYF